MGDSDIHYGSRRDVSAASDLVLPVSTKQPGVVAFLDGNEGDSRLISNLQLHAGLPHSSQLMSKHLPISDKHVKLAANEQAPAKVRHTGNSLQLPIKC